MRTTVTAAVLFALMLSCMPPVRAQHLWWNTEKQDSATCLYGEVTVLATYPAIYYCGANWHPGEPAGGYCGIQHNSLTERRTIFSVWDTSATLHPSVAAADAKTLFNRFGGEGEGAHTHMIWRWKVGETFQFFVQKRPGKAADTTDASYYVFNRAARKWLLSATITSPDGDAKSARSVQTIGGGGLASFLENFLGKDRDAPRLALYRLWLGNSLGHMRCLTRAQGDGLWGEMHDCYYLAQGGATQLAALYARLKGKYGDPTPGAKGTELPPVTNRSIPARTINALMAITAAVARPAG